MGSGVQRVDPLLVVVLDDVALDLHRGGELTGLDRELHDRLVVDLRDILRAEETTSVLVTHDVDEAEAIADRTIRLSELTA